MMNRWPRVLSSFFLMTLFASALSGCTNNADYRETPNAHTKSQDPKLDEVQVSKSSAGVTVRRDLETRLNAVPGIRNVTVLMYNGNAYVGFTEIGTEHEPDAVMKAGDTWQGNPYGTQQNPASAHGMTVKDMQQEAIRNGALHQGPSSTQSGNISEQAFTKVVDTVRKGAPGVQTVYVTGNIDHTQKLSGYKHFILRGGDMSLHKADFQNFVQSTFANAKTQSTGFPGNLAKKRRTNTGNGMADTGQIRGTGSNGGAVNLDQGGLNGPAGTNAGMRGAGGPEGTSAGGTGTGGMGATGTGAIGNNGAGVMDGTGRTGPGISGTGQPGHYGTTGTTGTGAVGHGTTTNGRGMTTSGNTRMR